MTKRHPPPQKRKRVFIPAVSRETETEPASPHRVGHSARLHAEDTPYTTTTDVQQHFKRPAYEPDELEAGNRITAISRRYNGIQAPDGVIVPDQNGTDQWYFHKSPLPIPARASRNKTITQAPAKQPVPVSRARKRLFWSLVVGIVFLVMIVGYVGLSAFGSWWNNHQNDATYGYPRTFQIDAVVGHHDSPAHPSHFITINLNRHIIIIEIPGGDISRSVIYSAGVLLGDGEDVTPVTLSFSDVNHDGKPDMIVHIADQTLVFLNNGTKFVPPSNLISGGGTSSPIFGGYTHADAAGQETNYSCLL